ncbi:hypothetical protein NQ314_008105 [Rhamnusium bicolor]|uniref:Uncharacterized protein n=1 Tax=Rhamnusium bicolor TaxID=1586634 RepID=A0AAV8YG39_9CUCU|nr:hypothetical protein NQ314_008105 [Rhamnusium bicolor]
MGGVDKVDMLLSSTECVRKTVKWYKKVFFHVLDMTLISSHVTYKMLTGKNIALLDFQRQLVKELLAKYKKVQPRASGSSRRPDESHSPLRLIERHLPAISEVSQKK